jgi:hypothetical protein
MYLAAQNGMRPRPGLSFMSGAGTSKTRRSTRLASLPRLGRYLSELRSLEGLAALTPDAATEQIFPQAKVRSGAGHDSKTYQEILASAQSGQIMDFGGVLAYVAGTGECKGNMGASLLKPALLTTASGVALKFAPQAFAAGGPIGGAIVLAVAGVTAIFGAIFGHHAAAIKKENSILCAAVPAANQSLQLIDQMLQSGQATPDQASAALDSVVAGFQQAVAPIIKGRDPTSSGECNAACRMLSSLRAAVLVKQSQYADLAAQQAANPVTGAVSSAASSLGIPPWLLYAAGGLLLWKSL